MNKTFTTPLHQRMSAGQALAVRRTLANDPRASALIEASGVLWADADRNQPIGITSTHGDITSLLSYTDDGFGDPDAEQIAGRYIYWAQHVPLKTNRPYIHHTMIIRPIAPFRRESDAEAFAHRVDVGRTLAIEQYKSLDSNTSWLLDMSEVWYRPEIGSATAYVTIEMLNSAYHLRCERGAASPPSAEEIAGELAAWIRMALTAAVFAANNRLSESKSLCSYTTF
jgi:hypothetical protein